MRLLRRTKKIISPIIARPTTPPTTPPTIAPVLLFPSPDEELALGVALAASGAYSSNCSGRDRKAGTKSPPSHEGAGVALHASCLQHPQKVSPKPHV